MRASVDPRTFAPYGSCVRRAAICASTGRSGRSTASWKSVSAPTWPPQLQPVEILDVDAAIIFADLLLPVEPMGLKLHFAAGEGPRIDNPVHTNADVDSLSTANTDDLGYVGEAIQNVVRALAGKVPVIGFVGAPFTLASYMIEGGASRNYIRTKRMMYSDEILWRRLMGKIVDVQAPFASLQVSAGTRCIQVFDSWVGALG